VLAGIGARPEVTLNAERFTTAGALFAHVRRRCDRRSLRAGRRVFARVPGRHASRERACRLPATPLFTDARQPAARLAEIATPALASTRQAAKTPSRRDLIG
jgi:hypothetical protein